MYWGWRSEFAKNIMVNFFKCGQILKNICDILDNSELNDIEKQDNDVAKERKNLSKQTWKDWFLSFKYVLEQ